VLSQTAPDHYATLVAAAGEPMPRAFDYCGFFGSLPPEAVDGWEEVEVLADAALGDLIAWKLPLEPHQDTGHVVFVAETPAMDDQGHFAVRVYDSASVPRVSGGGLWPRRRRQTRKRPGTGNGHILGLAAPDTTSPSARPEVAGDSPPTVVTSCPPDRFHTGDAGSGLRPLSTGEGPSRREVPGVTARRPPST